MKQNCVVKQKESFVFNLSLTPVGVKRAAFHSYTLLPWPQQCQGTQHQGWLLHLRYWQQWCSNSSTTPMSYSDHSFGGYFRNKIPHLLGNEDQSRRQIFCPAHSPQLRTVLGTMPVNFTDVNGSFPAKTFYSALTQNYCAINLCF